VIASTLVVASGTAWNVATARAAQDQATAAMGLKALLADPCFGAAAMDAKAACANSHRVDSRFGPDFAADDWGALAGVNKDGTLPDKSACTDFSGTRAGFLDCRLGAANSGITLAIVGDSHGLAITEPLARIAAARGWSVRVFLLNSCTPSLPMKYEASGKATCNDWREKMAARIAADSEIDVIVTTGFTRGEPEKAFVGTKIDLVGDYSGLWTRWAESGKHVIVVGDVPLTNGESVPDCVAARSAEEDPCSVPRADALAWDPLVDSVTQSANPLISFLDVTGAFCDASKCHSVIGGLIAYRDPHHLSATFALTLVPRFRTALAAAGY
jgi:hypothetical protein